MYNMFMSCICYWLSRYLTSGAITLVVLDNALSYTCVTFGVYVVPPSFNGVGSAF